MPIPPIRLLLVDDHTKNPRRTGPGLETRSLVIVGQATEGATAIGWLKELQPNVSLVDLPMAPMDGVVITTAFREPDTNARVVQLTTHDSDDQAFRGLQAGAASQELKGVSSDEMARTFQLVHAGRLTR